MGGDRRQAQLVIVLTLLAVAVRFAGLTTSPLWTDEAFSLWMARHSWGGIWDWTWRLDAHPPLYYLLLHLWLVLGDRVVVLRALSAAAGAATIPVAYLLGRAIGGARLGLLTALLLALSPFNVWYGQEARMYPFLMLEATVALLGLVLLLREPRPRGAWSFYVVGMTAALWTEHSAAILFVTANVIVMLFRRPLNPPSIFLRRWAGAQGVIVAAWSPALAMLLHQLIAGAAGPVSLNAPGAIASLLPDVFSPLFGVRPEPSMGVRLGVTGLALLASGPLIVRGLSAWRMDPGIAFPLIVWLLPIGCGVVLGAAGLPVLTPATLTAGYRTLIWIALVPYLLTAQGLLTLHNRGVRIGAWVLLLMSCVAGLIVYYRTMPKWEAWDRAGAYVARHIKGGDMVLFNDNLVQLPFDYQFRQYTALGVERGIPEDFPADGVREPGVAPADIVRLRATTRAYRRVWLIYSHEWWTDPHHLIPASLAGIRQITDEQIFPGLPTIRVYLFQQRVNGR